MLLNRPLAGTGEEVGPQGSIRVNVELQYKLGEKTEARLQEKGAWCIEEVTLREHYYDTESFHLASQQTWLSKQGSQWRMIIGNNPYSSNNMPPEPDSQAAGSGCPSTVWGEKLCIPPCRTNKLCHYHQPGNDFSCISERLLEFSKKKRLV
uniref:CYTH domain-containing protein n=1 Tax=Oncorhynchus mykiss TaxID=8022 RepID=A0A8C7SQJ3_ONCMY